MKSMKRSGRLPTAAASVLTLALTGNIAICSGAIADEAEAKAC
jgi:hypothetical protein